MGVVAMDVIFAVHYYFLRERYAFIEAKRTLQELKHRKNINAKTPP